MKYWIEFKSKGESQTIKEWVLATQLKPRNEPLPSKPEDVPQKGVEAWNKLVSGRQRVTICDVECKFSTNRYEK